MLERRRFVRITERRRFVRIPENSQISYEILSKPKIGNSITKDISQGGIRFFIYEFIPKNSLLRIRLTIKKIPFSFEAPVKVIWIEEDPRHSRYEVGVEFTNISQEATDHLVSYITNILTWK